MSQNLNNSSEMAANALKAKPCSLNLVPPAKKHKPRTYACESGQLSLGNRTGRNQDNSPTLRVKRGFGVSRWRSETGRKENLLTEVTQDGPDE